MKKLQKARTVMSVSVAGITAGAITLVSDQIVAALQMTDKLAAPATGNDAGKAFTFLPEEKRTELIGSMAQGRVVTMDQHGVRLSDKDLEAAKQANPGSYQRVLAR